MCVSLLISCLLVLGLVFNNKVPETLDTPESIVTTEARYLKYSILLSVLASLLIILHNLYGEFALARYFFGKPSRASTCKTIPAEGAPSENIQFLAIELGEHNAFLSPSPVSSNGVNSPMRSEEVSCTIWDESLTAEIPSRSLPTMKTLTQVIVGTLLLFLFQHLLHKAGKGHE